MRKKSASAGVSALRDRRAALSKVTSSFKHWAPAEKVLTSVKAVPTRFIQVDLAIRVGGWPIQRFALVHGPSSHGKTTFILGLGGSFLDRDHFFAFIDAEYTTPIDWVNELLGDMAHHPGFSAMRPRSYEEAVDGVREFCTNIAKAREKGDIDTNTSGIIIVDSLQKLMPKKFTEKLLLVDKNAAKQKKKGVDGMGGRSGQMLAALHNQWLRECTAMLYHSNTSMGVISREYDKPDASMYEEDFKVAGGRGPLFESSIACRIQRSGWVKDGDKIIGEKHRVSIYKTKVAGKETKTVECYFHTSNGVLVPAGFDRARDVLEVAREHKVVELSGNTYSHDGKKLGVGENKAVQYLTENVDVLNQIDQEVRSKAEA